MAAEAPRLIGETSLRLEVNTSNWKRVIRCIIRNRDPPLVLAKDLAADLAVSGG